MLFQVLEDEYTSEKSKQKKRHKLLKHRSSSDKRRSKSEDTKLSKSTDRNSEQGSKSEDTKTSKSSDRISGRDSMRDNTRIPTSSFNFKATMSRSERRLNDYERKVKSSMEARIPSLPNIRDAKEHRSVSNLSAPLGIAAYFNSDEQESGSEVDDVTSAAKKKRLRKRSKTKGARSAGSDYESSNVIDSGFEPSPRSSKIPKWRNMSDRGVNMTSVTQTIQTNIRRYVNYCIC